MKLQLKRSNVLDGGKAKEPTPPFVEYGELCVNYNVSDPALFIKDSNDNIIRIAGKNSIGIGGNPSGPDNPTTGNNIGDVFFNTGDLTLYYWDGSDWVPIASGDDNGFWSRDPDNGHLYPTYLNDKVGIGTNNPQASLHIKGSGSAKANVTIENSTTSKQKLVAGLTGTNNLGFSIYDDLLSQTTFRIDSSGNVGIGTNSPQDKLHVDGGNLTVENNTGNSINLSTKVGNGNASTFRFKKARGGSSGPTDISANDTLGTISWDGYGAGDYRTGASIAAQNTGGTPSGTSMPTSLFFKTTPVGSTSLTTRVVIKEDGKVGIGKSDPAVKLDINGKARSDSTVESDNGKTLVTKDYLSSAGSGGSGAFGYWTRADASAVSNLSPSNSGDSITDIGNITSKAACTISTATGNLNIATNTAHNISITPGGSANVNIGKYEDGVNNQIIFRSGATTQGQYRFFNQDNTWAGQFQFKASTDPDGLTANRTYTWPDKAGTVALTSDVDNGTFWTRSGTDLSPKTSGDSITDIGNITTKGTATISTAAGALNLTSATANVNIRPGGSGNVDIGVWNDGVANLINFRSGHSTNQGFLFFENTNTYSGRLSFGGLTANRKYQFQNKAGTIAHLDDIPTEAELDDRYVNLDGDTMTGDLTVPSLNGGPLAGFRNQIINGNFRIAQRGKSFSDDAFYFHLDRWAIGKQTGTSGSINIDQTTGSQTAVGFDYGVRVHGPAAGTLLQGIELPEAGKAGPFAIGTVWTVSVYANKDITVSSIDPNFDKQILPDVNVPGQSVGGSTSWEKVSGPDANGFSRYKATFTVTSAPRATDVVLKAGVGSMKPSYNQDITFTGYQLEPGPVATPFEQRPIGTELVLCQRYFVKHDFGNTSAQRTVTYDTTDGPAGSREQRFPQVYYFPVEMRVQPVGDMTDLVIKSWENGNGGTDGTQREPSMTFTATPAMRYIGAKDLPPNTIGILSVGGVVTFDAEL